MKRTINVTSEYTFENHNVNSNEDGRPKDFNGRFYLSGQKIRYMLFEKMKDYISDELGDNYKISTGGNVYYGRTGQ